MILTVYYDTKIPLYASIKETLMKNIQILQVCFKKIMLIFTVPFTAVGLEQAEHVNSKR